MKLYDMHTHTNCSHDAKISIQEQIRAQLDAHAAGFAVTDHCDVLLGKQEVMQNVRQSVREVFAVKQQFSEQIEILTGVEIGEGIWNEACADAVIRGFDFDVVLSSVHAVRFPGLTDYFSGIDFSLLSSETILAYVDQYYTDMIDMTERLDFDVLPHITCPLRYVNRKFGKNLDFFAPYQSKIETVLKRIIERGIALEINTAYATCAEEFLPSYSIVKLYRAMGGRYVTIGSDAHAPEQAAHLFTEAATMLKQCGFDGYYYYKNRKPVFVSF